MNAAQKKRRNNKKNDVDDANVCCQRRDGMEKLRLVFLTGSSGRLHLRPRPRCSGSTVRRRGKTRRHRTLEVGKKREEAQPDWLMHLPNVHALGL